MAQRLVELVGRVMIDPDFLADLQRSPETVLAQYELNDDAFHRTLAEAADNLPLLAIFDQLNAIRRAVAWGNVERQSPRPPADHASFAEHEEIADAIEGRNPDAAHAAMRKHLRSVTARLFGE